MDTALTGAGVTQARALGTILAREYPNPASLRYFASPLPRARHTMEIVLRTLGLPTNHYSTEPRIAEINLGAWDGLTHAEASALDPKAYADREADKWNVRVPGGGENYADVARRAEAWIGQIETDTFAVSHGAFTRILRGLFADMSWQRMSELDEPQGCVFHVNDNVVRRVDP